MRPGHASRFDRTFGQAFGDANYAREELITEMSAEFLAAEVGISLQTADQSASYIANWLEKLENDRSW
jgi:antirestriction protein ArdC